MKASSKGRGGGVEVGAGVCVGVGSGVTVAATASVGVAVAIVTVAVGKTVSISGLTGSTTPDFPAAEPKAQPIPKPISPKTMTAPTP